MPWFFQSILVAVTVVLSPVLLAAEATNTITVIKASRLVDTSKGRVLNNQTIVIRNGIIESVNGTGVAPADARLIDLSGMTVLPGLIDAHTPLERRARSLALGKG